MHPNNELLLNLSFMRCHKCLYCWSLPTIGSCATASQQLTNNLSSGPVKFFPLLQPFLEGVDSSDAGVAVVAVDKMAVPVELLLGNKTSSVDCDISIETSCVGCDISIITDAVDIASKLDV